MVAHRGGDEGEGIALGQAGIAAARAAHAEAIVVTENPSPHETGSPNTASTPEHCAAVASASMPRETTSPDTSAA